MTPSRRLLAVSVAVVLGLAPGAPALAQSAGDDQYSDPLGGATAKPKPKPKPAATSTQGSGSSAAPAPAAPATAAAAGTTTTPATGTAVAGATASTTAGTTSGKGAELPRTGSDTWLVGLVGFLLVLTGIGLRKRTADGRRS